MKIDDIPAYMAQVGAAARAASTAMAAASTAAYLVTASFWLAVLAGLS